MSSQEGYLYINVFEYIIYINPSKKLEGFFYGVIAQLAEHFTCTEEDMSSNLINSTK